MAGKGIKRRCRSGSMMIIWIKDVYSVNPLRVYMEEHKLIIDLLELVLEDKLFTSIKSSRPMINQLIIKHNGKIVPYDANITAIEGTTADNPVIVEMEEECKFCFSIHLFYALFYSPGNAEIIFSHTK